MREVKAEKILLRGRCGKCKRVFYAEIDKSQLPTVEFDDGTSTFKARALRHLVVLCPYDGGLLNLSANFKRDSSLSLKVQSMQNKREA